MYLFVIHIISTFIKYESLKYKSTYCNFNILIAPSLCCRDPLTALYSITYMYYSFVGCIITVLIGWTVSYFTGSESDLYDEELIHPWARKMADFFPGKKRRYASKELLTESKGKMKRNGSSAASIPANISSSMQKASSSDMQNSNESKQDIENDKKMGDIKNGAVNTGYSPDMPMDEVNGTYKTKL